jgi:hypothetical protein
MCINQCRCRYQVAGHVVCVTNCGRCRRTGSLWSIHIAKVPSQRIPHTTSAITRWRSWPTFFANWLGGIFARHGTHAYRNAWSHLQKALVHYLYGFDATQAEMPTAANELFQYAEQVEKHVQAGDACSKILFTLMQEETNVATCIMTVMV